MVGTLALYHTSVGKKILMAVTGLVLFGFVFLHMVGNLKIYFGREEINTYSEFLRVVGYPLVPHEYALWAARLVLLACVALHIWAAYEVSRQDLAARPVGYAQRKYLAATYASRTMRWSGVIIGLFVVYHLLHYTTGTLHPRFVPGDVYGNMVIGFQNPLASAVYIVAMIFLGLHLYHGVWSMAQTLGWRSRRSDRLWRGFASLMAVGITLGYISIPIAVLLGLVR
ncbi:MAG TPA: succinate dehydrogenase cytochrome b subunit [Chloroflexota bacterium]|jgi:succinate dehydrogenase / fumarate reductase cytochrome b subunit|nr:succinate dehydrogenase cytochrome b subunit [Chloroflexota bacterium]